MARSKRVTLSVSVYPEIIKHIDRRGFSKSRSRVIEDALIKHFRIDCDDDVAVGDVSRISAEENRCQ